MGKDGHTRSYPWISFDHVGSGRVSLLCGSCVELGRGHDLTQPLPPGPMAMALQQESLYFCRHRSSGM